MQQKTKTFICIASGFVFGASICCYWLKRKNIKKSK